MLGLVLVLIGVAALVLAVGFARAHPKPADEPLTTYVEDVAKGVEEEVVQEVETVVKKVRKKKTPPTQQ